MFVFFSRTTSEVHKLIPKCFIFLFPGEDDINLLLETLFMYSVSTTK